MALKHKINPCLKDCQNPAKCKPRPFLESWNGASVCLHRPVTLLLTAGVRGGGGAGVTFQVVLPLAAALATSVGRSTNQRLGPALHSANRKRAGLTRLTCLQKGPGWPADCCQALTLCTSSCQKYAARNCRILLFPLICVGEKSTSSMSLMIQRGLWSRLLMILI